MLMSVGRRLKVGADVRLKVVVGSDIVLLGLKVILVGSKVISLQHVWGHCLAW